MIVVNGLNGSGFEAVMNSFHRTLGERSSAATPYRNRQEIKNMAPGAVPVYERYIDKFSPADPDTVIKDITSRLPDGTWPPYNVHVESVRALMGGTISVEDTAVRMGGSLFNLEPREIRKIYLVLASPATIRFRRAVMRYNFKTLDMKYASDRMYSVALSMETRGWDMSEDSLVQEYTMFGDYVNNCLLKFGDKVAFIDGEAEELTFDGCTVTNRNNPKTELPGGGTDARKEMGADLERVYAIWDGIRNLATTRAAKPLETPRYDVPAIWFCARTHKMVGVSVCRRCMATAGDFVMQDARPGWDKEPCAFEVAYSPEPHKTIEESITVHNWNVLP